jgi:hypothetical protein
LESQRKTIIDTNKVTCKTMTAKIESMGNSRHHAHFIEYLVNVIENPPYKYNKNPENSNF